MPWQQFSIEAGQLDPETLSQFFEQQGALSVTFQDAADQPMFEPLPGETPLWSATRVVALFDDEVSLETLRQKMRQEFDATLSERLQVETLEDRDWERVWLDDFKPMQFGSRLWVCPAGMRPPVDDAIIIDLDPGLAFGTGTHPTTALCLEWLDANPPADLQVLDFGCGSGILAIAALKLGADKVWATDIDEQALWATTNNAKQNAVNEKLNCALPDELPPVCEVDVLLANILANPLIELTDTLVRAVRPGGMLVLSGILAEQAEQVKTAYSPHVQMDTVIERAGWVCMVGGKY
jgi:ribosomal protein L11 methyltransferase